MKTMLTILTLTFSTLATGQSIVPNWSFEDTVMCPTGSSQVPNAIGWNANGSADYFNSCAPNPDFSVPNNWGGYQPAATGNAYCAIGVSMSSWTDGREFIRRTLPSPLIIGTTYFVSLKVNLSISDTIWVNCASNNIGIEFSTYPINTVNNGSHIYTTTVITDTINWTTICGSFVADSAYTYVNIGNFFDDLSSTTQIITTDTFCDSYYFVDDICVSTDMLDCPCNPKTGLHENSAFGKYKIYPNPTNQNATLEFDNSRQENHTLTLYDTQGRLVKTMCNITTDKLIMDIDSLTSGLYFFQLRNDRQVRFTGKLMIE